MFKRLTIIAAVVWSFGAHAADPDPVTIGVLTDMSGPYSATTGKGAVVAAGLAIEDFNKESPDTKVELLFADHQNKPEIATGIARRWFDTYGASMISELTTSAVALAVQKLAEDRGRITIVSGVGSSDLTGEACFGTGFDWSYDNSTLAQSTTAAVIDQGAKRWFLLTVDYPFGQALQRVVTDVVRAKNGKVVGAVKHPLNTSDFLPFLLQAEASEADTIGLANAGTDLVKSIKQANELGLSSNRRLVALSAFITDIHAIGLSAAKNVLLTTGFYWNMNDDSRAWSKRFFGRIGAMPTSAQAGVYSSVLHYLRATKMAGSTDASKVAGIMRDTQVNDMFTKNGKVRADGRLVHDMYLVQVKEPSQSKFPWDYYTIVRTIPGDEASRSLADVKCPPSRK